MAHLKPIPTPIAQRWRRFRLQVFPVLVFLMLGALALFMWDRHAGILDVAGEVGSKVYIVTSPVDGILVGPAYDLFGKVRANQVLVQVNRDIDPKVAAAQLLRMASEYEEIRLEIAATEAQTLDGNSGRLVDDQSEARRLAVSYASLRIDVIDRISQQEAKKVEVKSLNEQYDQLKELVQKGVESPFQLRLAELRRDVLLKEIEQGDAVIREAEIERDLALQRINEQPDPILLNVRTLMAPLEAQLKAKEAEIAELKALVAVFPVTVPVGGTIHLIEKRPGEQVNSGDPIVEVVVDESEYILAFVRDPQAYKPEKGKPVSIRIPGRPVAVLTTTIIDVGPMVIDVPAHHLLDRKLRERGLPVKIALPRGEGIPPLKPGEMVEVLFSNTHAVAALPSAL